MLSTREFDVCGVSRMSDFRRDGNAVCNTENDEVGRYNLVTWLC